jgi:hypothetical protein
MKRIFTFLLIAFGTSPLLFSQVTMTKASHGFLPGQNHECQAVTYQSPGASGQNCVWDFSKATALNEAKSVADLSEENSVLGEIMVSRNDGCDFFFKTTESANEYWGYKAGNARLQYTEPIVKTKYPQTFGTQFSGKYAGTYTVEGSDYTCPVEGTYSTNADATGVILLPDGISYPALRVKTTEASASFERVKYLWYAQNVRLPLFVVLEDYSVAADGTRKLFTAQSFMNTQVKTQENVSTPTDAFSYQVSPNPFQNEIQLTYTLTEKNLVTVALYASGGTKLTTLVSQVQSGTQTLSKDLSQYTQLPGIYLLKITVGDKTYTEKLVKAY